MLVFCRLRAEEEQRRQQEEKERQEKAARQAVEERMRQEEEKRRREEDERRQKEQRWKDMQAQLDKEVSVAFPDSPQLHHCWLTVSHSNGGFI